MDCTTSASLISSQENSIWNEVLDFLNCKDLWGYIGGHTIRYTFHSRSHRKAMSRLDRCYYSHTSLLNAVSTMWVDATALLSDYNPLLVSLRGVEWNSCVPDKFHRIPLRVNLAWLQTSMFKASVEKLIFRVLSLKASPCMKWEFLVAGMQDVIRDCGKYFANILRAAKGEVEHLILLMTEKVDSGQLLSERDHAKLCDAYRCLHLIENNAIRSSKVRARCMEVNDLHANSKCFFDFLHAKRANVAISSLEFNGQILQDGNSIAHACTEHFEKLFDASFSTSDAWFMAIQDSLAYTPQIIDSRTADNCEKSIIEEEVLMALESLKNGKAPGLDGLTKEFVMAFWPSLKTLILDACNEIWSCQKMPFLFKQGKIMLIPKVEIPRKIGDWRPITMMNIIYKSFAKIFAMRLKPIIHIVVHPSQIGFVHKRSIYDNILFTQMMLEHAVSLNHEVVGMQIDFEKAFDCIRWDFIAAVLTKLGFGLKFCRLIYILGQECIACGD
ncbi:hypothetical protein KP509_23G070900 [Ceratopteris richardii]|uniref:Reverse transcriptase domain-containing protein n=1 Tax=Ceratopteris richardii TaxID=49495 RepID=A0A8T2S0Z4_CERRI|nr:hypothetical protein KP509_23G070900 [Ceratopteris richardii]